MKDLLHETGSLEVVIGRGSIAAYEIANLSVGDAVSVTDRVSGSPVDVLFNGQMISSGEVMILDDGVFGVRLTETGWDRPPLPFSGTTDDVTELLEFQVRLAAIKLSLSELCGVGRNTIINLGKVTDADDQLDLMIAGVTIAQGIVCDTGTHRFGIRLQRIEATLSQQFPVRTTGVLESTKSSERGIDHQLLTDKFTKGQVRTVSIIHERFAANLTSAFPPLSDWHVVRVDQVSYLDLVTNWIKGDALTLLESDPQADRDKVSSSRKFFVQSQSSDRRLSDEAVRRIESSQQAAEKAAPLTKIIISYATDGGFSRVVSSAESWTTVSTALRNAWKQRYSMAFPTARSATNDDLDMMFTDMEHFLIAQIASPDGNEVVTVSYPTAYVERIAGILDS